ncbi:hypothetical protein [uncultured Phascolarctobacterium sp.]|uniref:hypothetical protein n=1 Tax=Phascolarctobacterium sp. TaxID=2049039 RepID=UPI0025E65C80|nr:hypothetical protein [uncultured Phascolarctobacterium sp.]
MEKPYEQIRKTLKLFECNKLRLRFRDEDERARFMECWVERYGDVDDAEWNIAVVIMTARHREPSFYNMEKALREAQGIRYESQLKKEQKELQNSEVSGWDETKQSKKGQYTIGQGKIGHSKDGQGKNGQCKTGQCKTGYSKDGQSKTENNALDTAANKQKRALHMQGSNNLATIPQTPEQVAQEALMRYERRGEVSLKRRGI